MIIKQPTPILRKPRVIFLFDGFTEQLEQFNIWFQNLSLEKEVNKTYAVDYTRSISGKNGKESEHRFCYIYHYDGNWYVLDTALLGLQDPLA